MNIMSFAVASIVDANTGNGINRKFVDRFGPDYTEHKEYTYRKRASSILALLAKIKSAVQGYIDRSIAAAQEQKSIKLLLQMNERMQKDIGLTSIDIEDLRSGIITLDALSARREQNLGQQSSGRARINNVQKLECVKQESYELGKCA